MTNKDYVLDAMWERGRELALGLQKEAPTLTGTELNDKDDYIPLFTESIKVKNMLNREVGFVCRSSAGRVAKLLQVYNSDIYTNEPEELPAQWGFVWSQNPEKAKPFIALSTSPYNKGDCCIDINDNYIYKSLIDNNVFSPTDYPAGWEKVK